MVDADKALNRVLASYNVQIGDKPIEVDLNKPWGMGIGTLFANSARVFVLAPGAAQGVWQSEALLSIDAKLTVERLQEEVQVVEREKKPYL